MTNQIVFNKEQYKVLSFRLKKRILLRLLLLVCIAIIQKLLIVKIRNTLAMWCPLGIFVILAISLVQSINTFIKFSQNKITFKSIGKYFKVRFLDSKVKGATHYFKETLYCRILINLSNGAGGE